MHWSNVANLFFANVTRETLETVAGAHFVHFFSSATKMYKFEKSEKTAYAELAKNHCPKALKFIE